MWSNANILHIEKRIWLWIEQIFAYLAEHKNKQMKEIAGLQCKSTKIFLHPSAVNISPHHSSPTFNIHKFDTLKTFLLRKSCLHVHHQCRLWKGAPVSLVPCFPRSIQKRRGVPNTQQVHIQLVHSIRWRPGNAFAFCVAWDFLAYRMWQLWVYRARLFVLTWREFIHRRPSWVHIKTTLVEKSNVFLDNAACDMRISRLSYQAILHPYIYRVNTQ